MVAHTRAYINAIKSVENSHPQYQNLETNRCGVCVCKLKVYPHAGGILFIRVTWHRKEIFLQQLQTWHRNTLSTSDEIKCQSNIHISVLMCGNIIRKGVTWDRLVWKNQQQHDHLLLYWRHNYLYSSNAITSTVDWSPVAIIWLYTTKLSSHRMPLRDLKLRFHHQ